MPIGKYIQKGIVAVFVLGFVFLGGAFPVHAANLVLAPSSATFEVGSTFDVVISLDTKQESINAIDTTLHFPANKLQVVDANTSSSAITLWASQPQYNNREGTIRLQGGIPGGLTSSGARLISITFRVTSVGRAVINFGDESKVLLNDGEGTDALERTISGVYELRLPPPNGPVISSSTHPSEDTWYQHRDVLFSWSRDDADGYSYTLSENPDDIPDNVIDGTETSVGYSEISDGTHFFHIKSIRDGVWGGVSHFAVNIDSESPAQFPIEVIPSKQTATQQPIITFSTSDTNSGLSHYEIAVIPLSKHIALAQDTPFYIEANSPHVLQPLEEGSYDIVVRAHDQAGNVQESQEKLEIVSTIVSLSPDRGIIIENTGIIPWWVIWLSVGLIAVTLLIVFIHTRNNHKRIQDMQDRKELPPEVQNDLKKLEEYQQKYGALKILVAFIGATMLLWAPFISYAQENNSQLTPPVVTISPDTISNEEILYIGGQTQQPGIDVRIFIQNTETQEIRSHTVTSNDSGEWFYRHNTFLPSGAYQFWAQAQHNDVLSPPSPQHEVQIEETALQIGVSRISVTQLYLGLLMCTLLAIAVLVILIIRSRHRLQKRKKGLQTDVHNAEKFIHREFASLKRDIENELYRIRHDDIPDSEQRDILNREEQLLRDLAYIEKRIGKEIHDIDNS